MFLRELGQFFIFFAIYPKGRSRECGSLICWGQGDSPVPTTITMTNQSSSFTICVKSDQFSTLKARISRTEALNHAIFFKA